MELNLLQFQLVHHLMDNLLYQDTSTVQWLLLTLKRKLELSLSILLFHMLSLGVLTFWRREMMEKLPSMSHPEIVSRDLIIQKMRKSKSLLALLLISLEKLQLQETLIDSMFTTLTQKDLNGMKSAVNKQKTTIQLLLVHGSKTEQKLVLVLFAVQQMSLMYVSKKQNTKGNSNLLMYHSHK